MKFTTLKSLKINGEYYTHVINPKTDDTYLLDESDTLIALAYNGRKVYNLVLIA